MRIAMCGVVAAVALVLAAGNGPLAAEKEQTARMEELVVTATKTRVDPESVPFTMYSVEREDIEQQPAPYISNIGELIKDLPGVSLGQVYPLGPPWINLRGTGYFIGRTIYVVDGLPLLEPIMSTTINPYDVEKIDVLLGPSSALYGANASGGVVNVLTKSGREGMGVAGHLAAGSFNTVRGIASAGDRVGPWNYYFSAIMEHSGGYEHQPVEAGVKLWRLGKRQYLPSATLADARWEKHHLSGKIGWRGEQGGRASLSAHYLEANQSGGQPNRVTTDNGDQLITSLQTEIPLRDWAALRFRGGYQYFLRPSTATRGLSLDAGGNLVLNSSPTQESDWGPRRFIPLELQGDIYLGRDNTLTVGGFYSHFRDARRTDNAVTGARLSESHWKIDNTAVFIQDQQFFFDRRLSLVGGIRHDMWRYYDIFDSQSTDQRPNSVDKDYTTYRGGVRFKVTDGLALRASAGTAFWPGAAVWFFQNVSTGLTWREANPDLKPEKTWMVDFGVDLASSKTGTALSVTPYYGKIKDMVSYRYDENPLVPGGSIIRTQNLGGAEIYGVETLLSQRIVENLYFRGSLTLNRSRIEDTDVNDGNQLRNAPDYHGSVGLQYLNPRLFNADLRVRFSDSRYYDDENTNLPYFKMKSYETLDAKIWRDWTVARNWILTTSISAINILDKEYELELTYVAPGFYLETGIGLRYVF